MTNAKSLSVMFARIEAARSAKDKVALLKDNALGTTFSEEVRELYMLTLELAYNRNIRFGVTLNQISPINDPKPDGKGADITHATFELLMTISKTGGRTEKLKLIHDALDEMDQWGRSLFTRILAKDLRCGIGETAIVKAFPGSLPEFDVMLAKPFAARYMPAGGQVVVEPKLDGLRAIAEVDTSSNECNFYTRSGKPIESLDNYKHETISFAHQFVSNGEIVVFDGEVTSGTFLESMGSVRRKSEQADNATFHVFDVLVGEAGSSPMGWDDDRLAETQGIWMNRRAALDVGFKKLKTHMTPEFLAPTTTYRVSSTDEVYQLYNAHRDAGLEGVIVKMPNSPYVKKRSASWLKIKAEETEDLPIVGVFEGEGQFMGMLGGVIVKRGGVDVKVGSGFSAKQREEFWEQYHQDLKFQAAGEPDRCRLLGVPAEIQYQEVLPSGSLRHPVFVRLRYDKHNHVSAGSF